MSTSCRTGQYLQDVWPPHGPRSPQACAQDTKPCQMRKRRCNPPWDHMNKSAYHPVLLGQRLTRGVCKERCTQTHACIHSYVHTCRGEAEKHRLCRCDRCETPVAACLFRGIRDRLHDMNVSEDICVGALSVMSI